MTIEGGPTPTKKFSVNWTIQPLSLHCDTDEIAYDIIVMQLPRFSLAQRSQYSRERILKTIPLGVKNITIYSRKTV